MKEGYTHIGLVLDASGSMEPMRDEVLDSLRSFAEDQLKAQGPGETNRLDVWQFNGETTHVLYNVELEAYRTLDYRIVGSTALYDAICFGVDGLVEQIRKAPESERPEDVLFVIVTDGDENSSRVYSLRDVQARIKRQTEVYNWKFIFLAANIDVNAVGDSLGVDQENRSSLSLQNFGGEMRSAMNSAQESIREARRSRRGE